MKNEELLINDLKLGFRKIGFVSILTLAFSLAFVIIQLNYVSKMSHGISLYLVYLVGNILSLLFLALIYFAFLYLSGKINKIEKSKENTIFSTVTIIAVVLIFFDIGLFLGQFLLSFSNMQFSNILSIIYVIFYIILLLSSFFVYIFFPLSINKMNSKMEIGVITWPIVIYAIVNSIGVMIRIIAQVFIVLQITPMAVFTSILYSIFQFINLAVELMFIISMFFVANNAQISSLHQVPQYVPSAYSGPVDKSKQPTFCPFCGAQNSPDSKFCINCGKKIDSN
ncbi:MAG: zinc-ribbon domain-containing protein [Candidatus Heimdallarchaeum aukensis]|uniref:Zinc-ribbon domain-containing protein n=1 Tax=Candidatus Heimdallarchaeum aukensis TaxID=2876573 RepID=A0A9Y1FLL2_9ARCH|nr:MAG: zinc-ribbon domain-containing protein [Candidatus Heimdallarchaeum aukensis]